nr:endonuclease/exonuclease/phosphatase family protein [uncultured Allomuricauda sp.]
MKRFFPFLNKLILFVNLIFVLVTAIALLVPYIPVTYMPTLSTVSLVTPILACVHIVFVSFWLLRRKKLWLWSAMMFIAWYVILGSFYEFSNQVENVNDVEKLSIMSFNSRRFNEHRQLDIENVDSLILNFVDRKSPDILCFQECYYEMKRNNALSQYPYKYIDYVYGKPATRVIQAIYSKFPILAKDSILFPNSANSAVYADILYKKDTIRIYNVHLQSFRIIPEIDAIKNQKSSKLLAKSKGVMLKQDEQANLIRASMESTSHKKIVVGDFNNTQYSNIYKTIKGDLQDTFLEKGKGFGRTYNLLGFPMRIDYIFADSDFEVISHENFDVKLSDHYPVMSTLRLKSDE